MHGAEATEIQERQTQAAEAKLLQTHKLQAKIELDTAKAESQYALQSDQKDLKEAQFLQEEH